MERLESGPHTGDTEPAGQTHIYRHIGYVRRPLLYLRGQHIIAGNRTSQIHTYIPY